MLQIFLLWFVHYYLSVVLLVKRIIFY